MLRRVDDRLVRVARPRQPLRRVVDAELHLRAEKAAQRRVDVALLHEPLRHRVSEGLEGVGGARRPGAGAALEVGPREERHRGALGRGLPGLVALVDVDDRPAVGDDVPGEAPLLPEHLAEQLVVAAGRLPAEGVVGAHHRLGLPVHDEVPEGGEVGLAEVALADPGVVGVPQGLGPAVHRVVLGRRDRLQVAGVRALHALDERGADGAGQERVLAVGLLPSPPARVAEDVDVRRPEDEPLVEVALVARDPHVVHGPRFVGDPGGDPQHEVCVPGRGEGDRLREDRGAPGPRHAVQRLVPPGERRDPQPPDGRRALDHERDLLVERQAGEEVVDPLLDRQVGVAEGQLGRRLGAERHGDGDGEQDGERQGSTRGHCSPPG